MEAENNPSSVSKYSLSEGWRIVDEARKALGLSGDLVAPQPTYEELREIILIERLQERGLWK